MSDVNPFETLHQIVEDSQEDAGAIFSPCRTWRYLLWRCWDAELPSWTWILCNPSIADEKKLDPTLRKVRGFCTRNGAGGFKIVNLFALVSTDPRGLRGHEDPVGAENDRWIKQACAEAPRVVAAWGQVGGQYRARAAEVMGFLEGPVWSLGTTNAGYPFHPLMLPYTTPFNPFSVEA